MRGVWNSGAVTDAPPGGPTVIAVAPATDPETGLTSARGRGADLPWPGERHRAGDLAAAVDDHQDQRLHAVQRDPRRAVRARPQHGVVRRRPVRRDPHRQLGHRDRPGVPRQAEARPARPPQPTDDAGGSRRPAGRDRHDRCRLRGARRAARRRPGAGRRAPPLGQRAGGRRVEPHGRVRPDAQAGRRRGAVRNHRGGRSRPVRRGRRRRRLLREHHCGASQDVHQDALRDPGVGQHAAEVHHLGHRHRAAAADLVADPGVRRGRLADGHRPVDRRSRGPGPGGPGPPDVRGVPPGCCVPGATAGPGAGAAGRRGAGPRRRRLPGQDRDPDRRRHRLRLLRAGREGTVRGRGSGDGAGRDGRRPQRERDVEGAGRCSHGSAGLGADADHRLQLGPQVERGVVRRPRLLRPRCTRRPAARGGSAAWAGHREGEDRAAGGAARPQRGRARRAGPAPGHTVARPGVVDRAGAARREGHPGLLRVAGRRRQDHLRRQPADGGRDRPPRRPRHPRQPAVRRADDRHRRRGAARDRQGDDRLRPGESRAEAGSRPRAAGATATSSR